MKMLQMWKLRDSLTYFSTGGGGGLLLCISACLVISKLNTGSRSFGSGSSFQSSLMTKTLFASGMPGILSPYSMQISAVLIEDMLPRDHDGFLLFGHPVGILAANLW